MGLAEDVAQQVVEAVESLGKGSPAGDQAWVTPYAASRESGVNQLVVFLKPEVTATRDGARFDRSLAILAGLLDQHAVDVGAVRVVNGAFLERVQAMRKHYGVINAISRLGEEAVSGAARRGLQERFAGHDGVLGGHQFLAEYPGFSAYALHIVFANLGSVKLAPGTYACGLSVEGRNLVLLNGFHPYQLERFTRPDAVTVLLEGRTATPWRVLRQRLAGATDPSRAEPGSFRQLLLERAADLGLPVVSQNYNGLHVSAGPLEGMVELCRFFGPDGGELPVDATCFGQLLADAGLTPDAVAHLAGNPLLKAEAGPVSAFDLTEEMDAAEAVDALRAAAAQ